MHANDTVIDTQCTETHAYGTTHIDVTGIIPSKLTTAGVISKNHGAFISIQDKVLTEIPETITEFNVKRKDLFSMPEYNLEMVDTISNATEFSVVSENELHKPAQYGYGSGTHKNYPCKLLLQQLKNKIIDPQDQVSMRDNVVSIKKSMSNIDHIYEEVSAVKEPHLFEYDILDYYEKYSPTTAKTLINTLFLPRHKICKQCANLQDSPVYTDCLIYSKKQLVAREVNLYQHEAVLHFKYCADEDESNTPLFLQYEKKQPCMLVYNYVKTSASSIFYTHGPPRDVFDLKLALQPNIFLLSDSPKNVVNTELYHRYVNSFYTRISKSGCAPMMFHVNHMNILSSIKHVGYDTDIQNWMTYRTSIFQSRSLKQDDVTEHRANRSSLLLLEPLLLMPDLTSPRYREGKNRITHSEHIKIVRIVIAYTLSFVTLTIITFYVVYFT